MHLERDKCALCGKGIDQSIRFAPHNVAFETLAATYKNAPIFCSAECIDKYLVEPVLAELKEHIDTHVSPELAKTREDELKAEAERFNKETDISSPSYSFNEIGWAYKKFKDRESFMASFTNPVMARDAEECLAEYERLKACAEVRHVKAQKEIEQNFKQALEEHRKALRSSHKGDRATLRQIGVEDFFVQYQEARNRQETSRPAPPLITDRHRFEHTHILGPQGSGKSTLIQELILQDLQRPDRPAIIVIDPKGFMVDRIASLKQIDPNDLIIIDPRDKPPPALNLFSVAGGPKVVNQAISSFDYIFAQSGAALSPLMRPAFRFCARLMFSLPDPSIFKLMDFLESQEGDPEFTPYIDRLTDEGAKRFFKKDFYSGKRYDGTKEQVKARFQDILSMPEVMAMFNSKAAPIDFVDCLQNRKIILVNTAFEEVGLEASQLIGRYIISLVLASAFARGRDGPPAFLYIDEFQDYSDEDATPRQLRMAREYNLGMVLAHQQMFCNEFTEPIRSSVSSATVKYCSSVSGAEMSYMLKNLRCEQDFLDQQVPDHNRSVVKFACAVKGHPASSIEIKYPNITEDMQCERVRPVRTHEPPPIDEGSHGSETRPAEADKPIIAPKSTVDRGDRPKDW